VQNSNFELLKNVARRLRPLLSEVVFVGGCTTGLFITDEPAAEVRPTFDVDVIAEITSYADYATFSERLRALSFREDRSKGAPLCRWLIDEMKLDVMPIDEKILGFTNRWYRAAMDAAQETELEPALRIRLITPPYFIATKLEAFRSRGGGDYTNSHDLEDLLTVIDGREVGLSEDEQVDVNAKVILLQKLGPSLPRPHADLIHSSRHANMKELRIQHSGRPYRVLFAFDPRRCAFC
jgi:hypothetical protein